MNENNIKTLTDAYLISYMRAMEKTKNPNIAVGAAMTICTVLGNQMQNDAQRAAELYDSARLVIVPGDTHCFDYHLEMMTDAVKEFLMSMK